MASSHFPFQNQPGPFRRVKHPSLDNEPIEPATYIGADILRLSSPQSLSLLCFFPMLAPMQETTAPMSGPFCHG